MAPPTGSTVIDSCYFYQLTPKLTSILPCPVLQAEDRVLLVQSDDEEELKLQHLVVPRTYLAANWPVLHVAANEDGSYLAIAGRRGLTLYNIRAKR